MSEQIEYLKIAQESSERTLAKLDNEINEMKQSSDEAHKFSVQNFSAWRDYLHKYYILMLAIVGATGIYQGEKDVWMTVGLTSLLAGVLIGFTIINFYLYWERNNKRISSEIEMSKPYKLFNHPDVKGNNPQLSLEKYTREYIINNKSKLKITKDKSEKYDLKNRIKSDKEYLRLLKYWNMYGFDRIWVFTITFSLILTFVGIILILPSFLK